MVVEELNNQKEREYTNIEIIPTEAASISRTPIVLGVKGDGGFGLLEHRILEERLGI